MKSHCIRLRGLDRPCRSAPVGRKDQVAHLEMHLFELISVNVEFNGSVTPLFRIHTGNRGLVALELVDNGRAVLIHVLTMTVK